MLEDVTHWSADGPTDRVRPPRPPPSPTAYGRDEFFIGLLAGTEGLQVAEEKERGVGGRLGFDVVTRECVEVPAAERYVHNDLCNGGGSATGPAEEKGVDGAEGPAVPSRGGGGKAGLGERSLLRRSARVLALVRDERYGTREAAESFVSFMTHARVQALLLCRRKQSGPEQTAWARVEQDDLPPRHESSGTADSLGTRRA